VQQKQPTAEAFIHSNPQTLSNPAEIH